MMRVLATTMLFMLSVAPWMRAASANAREPMDAGAACRTLQKAIAKRDGLPESGPPGAEWFCDITPATDPALFVIALRSSKPAPYGRLFGWFALNRASGAISGWDEKKQRIIPLPRQGTDAGR